MSEPILALNDLESAKTRVRDAAMEKKVLAKVTWRLVPFMFLLYVVNYLDRANVAFAKDPMMQDERLATFMTTTVYGFGAGILYFGYCIFEIPSNLIMQRMGARLWMARIMITWGVISSAMMFMQSIWHWYGLRILVGFAEAGFFPGMILYLTYWVPEAARARTVARFMTASAAAMAIGAPLSGAILNLDGALGLKGWQWLYLLEGIPSVVMGIVTLVYLTDRPGQAHWLDGEERAWLGNRIDREEQHRETRHGLTLWQSLSHSKVWWLCLLYFTLAFFSAGLVFFVPTIIGGYCPDDSGLWLRPLLQWTAREELSAEKCRNYYLGILTAIPYLVAITSMLLVGKHSDHTGEHRWHVAIPAFVAALGVVVAAFAPSLPIALIGLSVAAGGFWSTLGPFWALPTSFLSGTAAAGGIALINSVGNMGGFAGPYVMGRLKDLTESYKLGLLSLAVVITAGGFLVLWLRHEPAPKKADSVPPEKIFPDELPG